VNDEVVHGIPGSRVLREGDLLSIDIGTTLEGYVSDTAATIAIGNVGEDARRLLDVTRQCLTIGIAEMKRGNHVGDIGAAVAAHAESFGFGVVRELVGHGVGQEMHEEPQVPNYGERGTGVELRPGLVLALEPMITLGSPRIKILRDGWTVVAADGKLAAHFEHTVALTESGPRVLTLRDYAEDPEIERFRCTDEAMA
jgi:methionyl aminopeptidase